ncbi:MAG: OmpA family protein [Bacteroidota bacterium]
MRSLITILILLQYFCINLSAQNTDDVKSYDFIPGSRVVFEDNFTNEKSGNPPARWNMEGGSAAIGFEKEGNYVSIIEYYTKLSPLIRTLTSLPDTFTLEYDSWLDAGYDGNPGIELSLLNGDEELLITPNRDNIWCRFPGGNTTAETPESIKGALFYDRWNHIAVSYIKKQLNIYINQESVISIKDCNFIPKRIILKGNSSQGMKMFFKNFRLAKGIPSGIDEALSKGKYITSGIRFDINKSTIKPESMGVLNEIATYLKQHPGKKLEVGGYTDSDGEPADNVRLSQSRAEAVKEQLKTMGADVSGLTTKGYGEENPVETNATSEGKANNRRVELVQQP